MAASSSNAPPPTKRAKCADARVGGPADDKTPTITIPSVVGPPARQARLARHAGNVELAFDSSAGCQVLFHRVSHESVLMVDDKYELRFDSDGFAELVASDGETVAADDMFEQGVYHDDHGRLLIDYKCRETNLQVRYYVDTKDKQFEQHTMRIRLGQCRSEAELAVCTLDRERVGCSMWWSLVSLYRAMSLDMYKGVASRWVWQGLKNGGWERWLDSLGLVGHIMQSQMYGEDAPAILTDDRFLPFHAMSTMGLIACLIKWWVGPKNRGALEKPEHREAAMQMLTGLIMIATAGRIVTLDIRLDENCVWLWPGPMVGENPTTISVNGSVAHPGDLKDAQHKLMRPWSTSMRWFTGERFTGAKEGPIMDLIAGVARAGEDHEPLLMQLVIGLGLEVEQQIREVLCGHEHPRLSVSSKDPLDLTRYQEDLLLAKHLSSTKQVLRDDGELETFSLQCDKARVGGRNLSAAYFLLPSGVAIEAFPQACNDYDGNIDFAEEEGGNSKETKAKVSDEVKASMQRQVKWLQRGKKKQAKWKPTTFFRKAAKRWIQCLDNQVAWSLTEEGLSWAKMPDKKFEVDDAPLPNDDELLWNSVSVAADQGSDGYSAMNYLMRQAHLVIEPMWCASHGSWRDFQKCVRDAGLWSFWLCMTIIMNVVHGPWGEDQRHRQIKESWKELRKRMVPGQCPLYKEMAANIIWERSGDTTGVDMKANELWSELGQTTPWALKDYKVNLARFWHGVEKAKEYAVHWSTFLLGWTWLALESDLLATTAVQRVLFPQASPGDEQARATTDSGRVGVDERLLRSSCTNAVVITVLFMSSRLRLFTLRMILKISAPVEAWYRLQAHVCRNAFENAKWLKGQVRGNYLKQLHEVLEVLTAPKDIFWVGFDDPAMVRKLSGDQLQATVLQNDEMADRIGLLALSMVAARMLRGLWLLRGWPQRLVGMLDSVAAAQRLCSELKGDVGVYTKFKAADAAGEAHVKVWLNRSVCRLPSVIQVARALRRRNWVPDAAFFGWLDKRSRRFTNSVLCEDGFNIAKNCRRIKGKKKYMRPQKALTTVLLKCATSKYHKYTPVAHRSAPACRGASVPARAWKVTKKNTKKWKGLVSTRQQTDWYSPGPDRDAVQYADLEMGKIICSTDPPRSDLLGGVWIGEVCDKKHKFILKGADSQQWFMPLTAIPGSCVLAWPGRVTRVANLAEDIFVFDPAPDSPSLVLVADFRGWVARSFQWRSPAYFASVTQEGLASWNRELVAVRPTLTSEEMPLLDLCAKYGFWAMGRSWLQKLGGHLGVQRDSGASDCDTVYDLSNHIIGAGGEEQAMEGLRRRLGALGSEIVDDDDAFTALDEAVEVLEKRDEKVVAKAREQTFNKAVEIANFREDLKTKVSVARAAVAKAQPRRKKKDSDAAAAPRRHKYPEGRIAQPEAKKMCPPGGFVWRGLNDGTWWGSFGKPGEHKRISRSWAAYGEEQALRMVLQYLWSLYLDSQGQSRDSCPWEGLFGEGTT